MDRRKAIREYKDTPRPAGVYRVRNLRTGRMLLGSSVDLPSILNRQRAALRLGSHMDSELQRDWNELGPNAFEFEVLDTLPPPPEAAGYDPRPELEILEQLWREKLAADPAYTGKPRSPSASASRSR